MSDGPSIADKFLAVARRRDVAQMKQMILSGLDINAPGSMGQTAMHVACSMGWREDVAALLDAGADPGVPCGLLMTPLSYAMSTSHDAVVQLLLERGADPNQLIDNDTAPLTLAASSGDEQQVRLLLKHKASQLPRAPSKDAEAITVAAGAGHLNIVRLMHEEFGAALNTSSGQDGLTPLCAAIHHHKEPCFDYLLEKGADIYVPCGEKKLLPLDVAVGMNNPWATEELLRRGMPVDGVPNKEGSTTLMTAALTGAVKTAEILLRHGANIEATMSDGSTARRIAEIQGHFDIIGLIDREQRRRHLLAVEQDAAQAHGGLTATTKVMRPLSFRRPQTH
jgi:ankyrin repeat protein